MHDFAPASLRVAAALSLVPIAGFVLSAPAAAQAAGAHSFALVNRSGHDWTGVEVRRSRTEAWAPLVGAIANGAVLSVRFADPDCAFDLRATQVDGTRIEWSGVNLCETRIVRLNRDAAGTRWVAYD